VLFKRTRHLQRYNYSTGIQGSFSEREVTFVFASLYAIAGPSICRLSVTFVHPTQPVKIFGNVSLPFGTLVIR